jgi:hypothetical protein
MSVRLVSKNKYHTVSGCRYRYCMPLNSRNPWKTHESCGPVGFSAMPAICYLSAIYIFNSAPESLPSRECSNSFQKAGSPLRVIRRSKYEVVSDVDDKKLKFLSSVAID